MSVSPKILTAELEARISSELTRARVQVDRAKQIHLEISQENQDLKRQNELLQQEKASLLDRLTVSEADNRTLRHERGLEIQRTTRCQERLTNCRAVVESMRPPSAVPIEQYINSLAPGLLEALRKQDRNRPAVSGEQASSLAHPSERKGGPMGALSGSGSLFPPLGLPAAKALGQRAENVPPRATRSRRISASQRPGGAPISRNLIVRARSGSRGMGVPTPPLVSSSGLTGLGLPPVQSPNVLDLTME
jgi:hypothetical protein